MNDESATIMRHENIKVGDGGTAKRDGPSAEYLRDIAGRQQHPLSDVTAELTALLDRSPGRTDPFSLQSVLTAGQKVYDKMRRAISEAETAYTLERARLVDSYRVRFEEVRHEAREAIRKLEEAHEQRMETGQRILNAYDDLRQT
jgi:hypothetical protein